VDSVKVFPATELVRASDPGTVAVPPQNTTNKSPTTGVKASLVLGVLPMSPVPTLKVVVAILFDPPYPPSQKSFLLRRDFVPGEARGEDSPSVSSGELHFNR